MKELLPDYALPPHHIRCGEARDNFVGGANTGMLLRKGPKTRHVMNATTAQALGHTLRPNEPEADDPKPKPDEVEGVGQTEYRHETLL